MKSMKPSLIFATALVLLCSISAWAFPTVTTTLLNNFKIVNGQLLFQATRSPYGPIMTISPTTLAASETYTIPDMAQNANFVLSTGAPQANGLIGTAQVSPDLIQHVAIPLTAAQEIAMYGTPVQLIAAGGAGTNIVVHKVMFTQVTTATAFTGGGVVEFQIGNTIHGAGTATTATVAAAVVTAAAGTSYTTVIPVSYTGTAATGLYISNQTAAFAAGTGTATVDVWYSLK